MYMLALMLFQILPLEVNCYRFGQNQVECWYQLDMAAIQASIGQDTSFKSYSYRFVIRSVTNHDSIVREGRKVASTAGVSANSYILDFVQLHLFPGTFTYRLEITAGDSTATKEDTIMVESDTVVFSASDIILSKKNLAGSMPTSSGHEFIPMVVPEYTFADTLISYLEIYGLVPDSLPYAVIYEINDHDDRSL
jgi:hypothetical protein